jgi:hypothetical protein
MNDFAFRDKPNYVDIYPGKGGRDSKPSHTNVSSHDAAKIVGIGHNDLEYGLESRRRSDAEGHVVVPHGSKAPGKYRRDRHSEY